MDYEVLKQFRESILTLGTLSCDSKVTGRTIAAIQKNGLNRSDTNGALVTHELLHLTSLTHRFRVVRHLPDIHYNAILKSNVLHLPNGVVKTNSVTTNKILAAQCSSLALGWGTSSNDEVLKSVRELHTSYSKRLKVPSKYALLPETLNNYMEQAQLKLQRIKDIMKLVRIEEGLESIEEDICSFWAQLRKLVNLIIPLISYVKKLYLDIEMNKIDQLLHDCDQTFRMLTNRDVDIPNVRTPLGQGTVSRLLPFIPDHQSNNNDDSDSDEWEDPIEIAAEEPEHLSDEDDGLIQTEGESHLANIPRSLQYDQFNKLSKNPTDDVKSSTKTKQTFSFSNSKSSSQHNNDILNALEGPSNRNLASNIDVNKTELLGRNKKKKEVKSVHDRLRSKLGVRKRKKR